MKILKIIYNIIPFKKQFFLIIKQFFKLSHNIYKHLTFKGIFEVKISSDSNFKIMHYGYYLENEIFWNGINEGFEKESIKLWVKLCSFSNNIIDIGSNTGIYSLVAKAVNRVSNVYAFEPVERVFNKLEANCKLNNYHINCHNLAISNKDGDAFFYDSNDEHTYSVTINATEGNKDLLSKVKTPIMKLSSFVEKEKIKNIDLLKIDVETHEVEVIEGYIEYIKQQLPTMLIEIIRDKVAVGLENLLKDLDYHYFAINEKTGPVLVDSLLKREGYNFLICNNQTAKKLNLM